MPRPFDASFQDPLTGLSNRRHFEVLYDFAFLVADRGVPITVVEMELDDFPEHRSSAGPEAADRSLETFAQQLAAATRITDVASRLEEGRFRILLMDCNIPGALIYADRVRDQAREFSEATGLTLSVGMGNYSDEMEAGDELLALAEKCLEGARRSGGDRVVVPADLEE